MREAEHFRSVRLHNIPPLNKSANPQPRFVMVLLAMAFSRRSLAPLPGLLSLNRAVSPLLALTLFSGLAVERKLEVKLGVVRGMTGLPSAAASTP
jgi:hypothetical protein